MHRLNSLRSHSVRSNVRPEDKPGTWPGLLEHIEIKCAVGRLANIVKLGVSDHAHDFVALVVTVEENALPERAAISEIVMRHGLVDDGHARTALVVEVEVAARE